MAADPAFAQEVRLRRIEWESLELLAEKNLRAQIRQSVAEHQPENKPPFFRKWRLPLAALALLTTAVVLFFLNRTPITQAPKQAPATLPQKDSIPTPPDTTTVRQPDSPAIKPPAAPLKKKEPAYQAIALAAYTTPESLAEVRGSVEPGDTLSLAQEAFARKDYRQVINLLASLPENSRQEAVQIRAHAYFILGNYASSGNDFAALIKGGLYRRDAEWFGLLSGLAGQVGDKKDLMAQLDKIRSDEKHPWQKEAGDLWEKLN